MSDPIPPMEVPEGQMRVWDADQKKVILVPAPPSGPDMLTLTVRLHDPKEKRDPKKSAVWHTVKIPRAALSLSDADFAANHLLPAVPVILGPHKQ
jgi:hypothetical protein